MVAPLQYDGKIYKFVEKLYKGDGVLENPEYLNLHLSKANSDNIKRIAVSAHKEGKIFSLNPDSGVLDLTFTRNDANKTRVNSEGQVEDACYNLLSNTKTFSGFTPYTNTTIYTDFGIIAPNEEPTAIQVEKSNDDQATSTGFSKSLTLEKNKYYNYSCYIKYLMYQEVSIKVQVGSTFAYLKFNLQTGEFLEQANTQSYTIQPLNNGWYRVDICFLSDATATDATIGVDMPAITNTAQRFYIWGPQVSLGKVARPYLPTTNRANVPGIDYSTGQPTLLLEKARSNNFANSENLQTQSISFGAGRWNLSFYGTGSITVTGGYNVTLNGSGTNARVGVNFTPTPGVTTTFTASGQVLKAQLEFGYYATSYIKSNQVGGTAIAQDKISISNLFTNGITSSAGGTWYIHLLNNSIYNNTVSGDDVLYMGVNTGEVLFGIVASTGSSRLQIYCDGQTFNTTTQTIKVAFKWDGAELKTFLNGALLNTKPFTTTNLQRLSSGTITSPLYIADMWLAPTPLSDSELIALTTL